MERRTMLSGAAWSVPLVAVAIAAPSAVASARYQSAADLEDGLLLASTFVQAANRVPDVVFTFTFSPGGYSESVPGVLVGARGYSGRLTKQLTAEEDPGFQAMTVTSNLPVLADTVPVIRL
jgi:hypothetical protein